MFKKKKTVTSVINQIKVKSNLLSRCCYFFDNCEFYIDDKTKMRAFDNATGLMPCRVRR